MALGWVGFVRWRSGDWIAGAPSAGHAFYLAQREGATGAPFHFPGYEWVVVRYEPERDGVDGLAAQDRYYLAKAARSVIERPGRAFFLWLERAALAVSDPAPFTRIAPEWLAEGGAGRGLIPFPAIPFWALFGLGAAGLALGGPKLAEQRGWAAACLFAVSLPVVTERYRIVAVPSLVVGAAYFLSLRPPRPAPWLLAAALAALSAACGRLSSRPTQRDAAVAMAIQARYGGTQGPRAAELLEAWRRQAPDDPEALYHLGELYATVGEFDRAEETLGRLAELRGGEWPGAWGLVASARAARGDWQGAREASERQARLAPRDLAACMDGLLFGFLETGGRVSRPDACPAEHAPASPELEELYRRPPEDPKLFAEGLLASKLGRLSTERFGPAAERFLERLSPATGIRNNPLL